MTTAGMTADNPTAHETLRKSDLGQIGDLLQSQRLRTVDLTTQGSRLWIASGNLIVQGVEPLTEITDDGTITIDPNGTYAFGDIGIESLSARIDVPSAFLKDIRKKGELDLFDTVVGYRLTGMLNGEPSAYTQPDGRVHTLRLLKADNSADNDVDGMVRAVLGGRYMALDNLDMLMAVMEGMFDAGITPNKMKVETDLTESRMVIKVWVPDLYALAPDVFQGYRSPFSGQGVDEMPRVFAGLVASNSEVGRGRWSIGPRIVFQACNNGTNITKDAFGKSHVGEQLADNGVIRWSQATQLANLKLITEKTKDAVRTFLNVDYLRGWLAEKTAVAATELNESPETTVTRVTRHTGHTSAKSSILAMYMQGGQFTAGGVMQAYTAAAQIATSGDVAFDLENQAVSAMEWAASRSR